REITELMSLRADPASSCAEVKEKALEKASEIETRIVTLTNMAVALTRMAEKCDSDSLIGDCPILDALDDNSIGDSP
ncbi:MAG: MerR family DNA-binding protein, partial [Rhodothermales bacterium]|nr:MerR family DNA-binding protein [Rhodothermales bacterium]